MRAAGALREEGYVDRVMDPGSLPALASDGAEASVDERGFRAWTVETRAGTARADVLQLRSATELGQSFRYLHQTVNHGAFQAEAEWRHGPDDPQFAIGTISPARKAESARLTLRNFGLPLTPHVLMDSAVGDIYSEVTQVLARTYRLSLGTSVVRGASARVSGAEFEVRAGTGLRGMLAGSPYPGFERTPGSLSWAGTTVKLSPELSAGIQVDHASSVQMAGVFMPQPDEDVTSVASSVAYRGPDAALQPKARLIHLHSRPGGAPAGGERDAQGLFLEGSANIGGYLHEGGAYATDGNLRFGDYLLTTTGTHGAYWRVDTSTSRASWSAGVDYDRQEGNTFSSFPDSRRVALTGSGQYRLGRWDAVGGLAHLVFTRYADSGPMASALAGTQRSVNANAYYQTRFQDWAPTRLRVSVYRNERLVANDVPATGEEFAWEQEWVQGADDDLQRSELTSTLAVARDRSAGRRDVTPTAGVNFRVWPQPDWFVGGTLRYTARDGNLYTSRGFSGTLTSEKQVSQGWYVGVSASLNQAVVRLPVAGLASPEVVRSNDKSVQVHVRWEDSAGQTAQGLGVREPGAAGAGSIAGIVFLDADQDGRQSLNELGAAGVEVVLDGLFRVVTDRLGRFDFPLVATGRHQLSLTPETVPLPWGTSRAQDVRVDVPLRGQGFVRIPVVRTGD